MNLYLIAAVAAALLALGACATRPSVPRAAADSPLVIERDLVGRTIARGEFRAITGVRRAFTATIDGTWDGEVLTLVEDFVFDDGARDRKTWRLRRVAPGRFIGSREDVVGEALGFQDGNVFRLEYDMRLPSENGAGRRVRFRDVLALTRDGAVLNRANVGFWGLRVARVELTMRREGEALPAQ